MGGFLAPIISFDAIDRAELNEALTAWGHKMGPLNRPSFRPGIAHGLRHDGVLVAVTATEQMIPAATAGLSRDEALELARVCAVRPDLCRVAVRLWREFVFPAVSRAWGTTWAISYQDAALHTGGLYRFDGWIPLGRSNSGPDRRGLNPGRRKVIWGWHADPVVRAEARKRIERPMRDVRTTWNNQCLGDAA